MRKNIVDDIKLLHLVNIYIKYIFVFLQISIPYGEFESSGIRILKQSYLNTQNITRNNIDDIDYA